MSHNGKIKLVCFDLGGVLIRICRSWEEGCRAAGLDLRAGTDVKASSGGWYAPRELTSLYQIGRMTCEEFAHGMSRALDGRYSAAEIMHVHHAWMLSEYEGVGAVIDRIHEAGLRTSALSNTNHSHWSRMGEFPAVMKLQLRLASHELGLAKPDEAIYREAERRWGVGGPAVLFFDDLPENIETARRLNWRTFPIDHARATNVQIEAGLRAHHVL